MTLPNLPEVLILLFVIVLVLGAGKLRALGEALGRGVGSFGASDVGEDDVKERRPPAGPEA